MKQGDRKKLVGKQKESGGTGGREKREGWIAVEAKREREGEGSSRMCQRGGHFDTTPNKHTAGIRTHRKLSLPFIPLSPHRPRPRKHERRGGGGTVQSKINKQARSFYSEMRLTGVSERWRRDL